MPIPSTVDQFLELASRSGLLEPQHLQAILQRRRDDGTLPSVPRALANAMVRDGLLTRFQVNQLLLGKWRHFILSGKYKILGPLGSGGMGRVYLCEHQIMRRRVAVKVLPVRANGAASLERFHREARAVAQLKHTNIVGGYDIDQDGKLHFLVMEYIEGSTLHTIVRERGPMAVLRATHYVRQAALGLQHAHEAGLVHRDIKPSNLLLDRTGTVKVLDLGLARFFHDEADDLSQLHAESPVGTLGYMAPEQAVNSHDADIRADIYGLGATFYFLLAGHGPFGKGTGPQKLLGHRSEPPRPIRDVRPEVSEGLAAVLDRMMAREPAERYQTPAEVAEVLAPWARAPIPPPPPEEMPELDAPAPSTSEAATAPAPPAGLSESAASTHFPDREAEAATSSGSPSPFGPRTEVAPGSHVTPVPRAGIHLETAAPPEPVLSSHPPLPPAGDAGDSARPGAAVNRRRRRWALLAAAVLLLGAAGFAVYQMTTTPRPPAGTERPARLRLLIPAYFYPAGADLAEWDRIIDSPAAQATVAIANPENGPGKVADPNYVRVVERARRKGVTVIGYVSTKYAARPLHEVKGDVDRWLLFYPGIEGIFFDEQASTGDQVHYYAALYEYVRKERGLSLVVTNPGTTCGEEYLARPAADVVCLVEVTKDFSTYHRPVWTDRYPAERFAALLCQTGTTALMEKNVREMRDNRLGYCFITDTAEPNPWGRLPHYWEAEVEAVQQAAAHDR